MSKPFSQIALEHWGLAERGYDIQSATQRIHARIKDTTRKAQELREMANTNLELMKWQRACETANVLLMTVIARVKTKGKA